MKKLESKKYEIDAKGKILGRVAAEAAVLLRGKNSADFLPYLEPKNKVIIFNIEEVKVTGKKLKQKMYYRHSGYPGGLKQENLEKLMQRDPCQAMRLAVYGMLPKNRTRDKIIKNLELYRNKI